MTLRSIPIVLLTAAALCGQTTAKRAEFEVASIKPSGPLVPGGQVNAGVHIDGAQMRCNFLALKDYVAIAYQLKHHQIQGPEWIVSERFNISATIPEGTAREKLPEMMQNLLAERFQLKIHRDTKDYPVYGLVVAKGGLKIKETPPDPPSENAVDPSKAPVSVNASGGRGGTTVNFGNGSTFSIANNKFVGKKLTMAALAETLARFTDRPVIDATEQKANYDFELEFTPEDFRAMMVRSAIAAGVVLPAEAMKALEASGDSLFTALQTLGLRLENRKSPIEVVVIDSVLKVPTEN